MAAGLIGALRVTLGIDASQFENGTKGATRHAKQLQKNLEGIGNGVTTAGQALSVGLTLPFAALMRTAIPAARESREALGQVEQALKSMGPASGKTAEGLKAAAEQLQALSTFDDDDILRKVTANLLTFGNISGDVFDRTQQAAVDLAARMGTDLQGATLMLGKALNDPAKGLAALRRVGIQFTQQQQDQIKKMVEAKNVAGAQAIMLKELERQFGGSAKAMRDANPDQAMIDNWRNFQETVGEMALKVLPILTDFLSKVFNWFNQLSPAAQNFAVAAVAVGAGLGPILMVLGPMIGALGKLLPLLAGMGASGAAAGAGATAAATGTTALGVALRGSLAILGPVALAVGAVYLAWQNWDKIGPILSKWGSGVAQNAENVVGWLNKTTSEVRAQNAEFAKAPPSTYWEEVKRRAVDTYNAVNAQLKGIEQWSRDVDAQAVAMWQSLDRAWTNAKISFNNAITEIGNAIRGRLFAVFDSLKARINQVGDWFYDLYDRVVGHSYIPDMVDQIGQNMDRLDQLMVDPAQKKTKKAAESFREMASEVNSLLERLFPAAAAWRQYTHEIELLDQAHKKGIISAEAHKAALDRIREEGIEAPETGKDVMDRWEAEGVGDFEKMDENVDILIKKLPDLSKTSAQVAAETAKNFAEMARDVVGTMQSFAQQIKSGDILGAITSALDIISQIAGAIAGIRGGAAPVFNRAPSAPGFSTGGSFKVGGSGGVDSQLMRFRASPGEMVHVTRGDQALQQQAIKVYVVKGDMFDAHVERVAGPIADDRAARAALAGSGMAQRSIAKQNWNNLNGG